MQFLFLLTQRKNVTFDSSNESVATVDNSGNVTAIAKGTNTITVTAEDGGFTASCVVTVSQTVTGVTLEEDSATVNAGGTLSRVNISPITRTGLKLGKNASKSYPNPIQK